MSQNPRGKYWHEHIGCIVLGVVHSLAGLRNSAVAAQMAVVHKIVVLVVHRVSGHMPAVVGRMVVGQTLAVAGYREVVGTMVGFEEGKAIDFAVA